MKLKSYLLVAFVFVFCQLRSQSNMVYALPEPDMKISFMDVSKYRVLDSAYICVTYQMSMIRDTLNPKNREQDVMTLQIGSKLTKFYSENIHQNDSVCTELAKTSNYRPLNESAFQGYEIFSYNSEKKYVVTNRMPFSGNVFLYEDKFTDLAWEMSDEKTKILGFDCQKAETTFRGRCYSVWFSPEIPVSYGPWKLGGLPGLILKASDADNQYIFECIGLSRPTIKVPIKEYVWKPKTISLKDWMKLEENYHKRALNYLKINDINIQIKRNGDWGPIPTDWKMPYNPIEKEK